LETGEIVNLWFLAGCGRLESRGGNNSSWGDPSLARTKKRLMVKLPTPGCFTFEAGRLATIFSRLSRVAPAVPR
jgi:hypothetical protein